ncbi:MAG: ABC transporter permease [Acidobacteriia bacterium]|nr:ABC transporter permease [Terriglobia bacterium]
MPVWSNVRFALRLWHRAPGVTAITVLSTGLSVGAVASVFTAVRAVLLEPLPYSHPEQLVLFRGDYRHVRESEGDWVSRREAEAILAQSRTLARAGFWRNAVFDLQGDGNSPPEALYGLQVTASLLPTLGVTPMLGRNIEKTEETDTGAEMILSYGLWMRRFHGDRAIVGRTVNINGRGCRIIGVMGPEFNFPLRREAAHTPQPYVEFWAPMSLEKRKPLDGLEMVARLNPDAALAEAQQEVTAIGERLAREFSDSNGDRVLRASPLRERAIGLAGEALWLLMGAGRDIPADRLRQRRQSPAGARSGQAARNRYTSGSGRKRRTYYPPTTNRGLRARRSRRGGRLWYGGCGVANPAVGGAANHTAPLRGASRLACPGVCYLGGFAKRRAV